MKVKIVDAEYPDRAPRECQEIQAWKVEEKQSDVNLALQAYHDAITGQIDHAVIVTNDTDIAPALEMIRVHTNVLIGVVVPTTDHTRPPNTDLVKLAHWKREYVNASELAACQLPRVIQSRKPTIKPESWYGQPELLQEILDLAIARRQHSNGWSSPILIWMASDRLSSLSLSRVRIAYWSTFGTTLRNMHRHRMSRTEADYDRCACSGFAETALVNGGQWNPKPTKARCIRPG